jgi:hypothetical protein
MVLEVLPHHPGLSVGEADVQVALEHHQYAFDPGSILQVKTLQIEGPCGQYRSATQQTFNEISPSHRYISLQINLEMETHSSIQDVTHFLDAAVYLIVRFYATAGRTAGRTPVVPQCGQ